MKAKPRLLTESGRHPGRNGQRDKREAEQPRSLSWTTRTVDRVTRTLSMDGANHVPGPEMPRSGAEISIPLWGWGSRGAHELGL